MDESRRLAMRRAHVGRSMYCTCGKTPHGNGGIASHRAMHERRGDGHYGMTYSTWCDVRAGRIPMPPPHSNPKAGDQTMTPEHERLRAFCHADRDGECHWIGCPQLHDGEPAKSGRHCPIDLDREDDES